MSDIVFPALPGLQWDRLKKPTFSTSVHKAVSGKEARASFWFYPIWQIELAYEILRADATDELNTLMGLFLQMHGAFDTFLYEDPEDCTVVNQGIGTGDGAVRNFQLLRRIGSFVEPIKAINGTPQIYLDGVIQEEAGWTVANGLVTFAVPPANGVMMSASFSFYFRCRFLEDEAEFSQFMYKLWSLKQITLVSVK
jgi:uncharacterized protein (TIGR02217 family)